MSIGGSGQSQAISSYQHALDTYLQLGDEPGQAGALSSIGAALWQQGEHEAAVEGRPCASLRKGCIGGPAALALPLPSREMIEVRMSTTRDMQASI